MLVSRSWTHLPLDLASLLLYFLSLILTFLPTSPSISPRWSSVPSRGLGVLPSHPGSYLQQTCQVRAKPAPSTHVGGSGECLIQPHVQPWVPGDTSFPSSTLTWSRHYLSLHLPFQICPVHTDISHPSSLAYPPSLLLSSSSIHSIVLRCSHTHTGARYIYILPG